MVIDIENDHNTNDSSKRLAKMYVDEVFKGGTTQCLETKDFPNFEDLDEMYTLDCDSSFSIWSPLHATSWTLPG